MAETMSLTALDYDGSLANPVMQLAVLTWALILTVPLWLAYVRIQRRWYRTSASMVILAAGLALSPMANRQIALVIYHRMLATGSNVGLIGGPPTYASCVLALAVIGLVALLSGRSGRLEMQALPPGQEDRQLRESGIQ